jgi:hypothetical protein
VEKKARRGTGMRPEKKIKKKAKIPIKYDGNF